jgi:hypothetical protein
MFIIKLYLLVKYNKHVTLKLTSYFLLTNPVRQ